jgi:HlyD family secretion protein
MKTLQTELALKKLALRRIDAELTGKRLQRRPDDSPELFARIDAQFLAHRQALQDTIAQEEAMLARARHDLVAAQETRAKLEQVLPSYRRSASAYEDLGRQGFAGAVLVQEKARERIEKEQELKAQLATVESVRAAIAQSQTRLAQIVSSYRSQLQNERIEAESERERLQQELDKQNHRTGLLELKAPQAGIVKDLATHTRGTVVSPGTVVVTVVPQSEPLQA